MGHPSDGMLLTTSEVADLLAVHPSTVKRWTDEGRLRTRTTGGGHRRIHLTHALDTAGEQGISTFLDTFHPWQANVWLAVRQASRRRDFGRVHSLSLSWLSQGETDLMGRLLLEVGRHPDIPFTRFLDEGVRGLMARVGEEWIGGRLQVGEEHMATQVVMEVLVRLRSGWDRLGSHNQTPQEAPPVAVVGSMEGDHHELGGQAVRIVLEREGWRVYYLGGDVPLEDFAAIQTAQLASLVCISFSPRNTLPDLQRAVRVLGEFYRPRYPYALALGGSLPDIDPARLGHGPFGAMLFSGSVEKLSVWARSLLGREEPLGSGRPS
jgi:excisionase family DNA binding protein